MRREGKETLVKILNRITLATLPNYTNLKSSWLNLTFNRPTDYQTFFIETRLNSTGKPLTVPQDCDAALLLEKILIPYMDERSKKYTPTYNFPLELQEKSDQMFLCHYKNNQDNLESFFDTYHHYNNNQDTLEDIVAIYYRIMNNEDTLESVVETYYNAMDNFKIVNFNNWYSLSYESLFKKEYLGILVFLSIATLISVVIIMLSYLLSANNPETEKLSTYECGFEPYEDARHTVSIKFCIIAVLFIIFDIEIIYLIPWSVSLSVLPTLGFWSMIEFILELGIGIFYVWIVKSIEWD
jgi:NADH-quinone oxidoreductase subunit A